jgi:rare lipoprotein A
VTDEFRVSGFQVVSLCLLGLALGLSGCASVTPPGTAVVAGGTGTKPEIRDPKLTPKGGGYYLDDGPGDNPPPNLDAIPDAEPKPEPLHKFANRPYTAMGQTYVPDTTLRPYREKGVASWYGRRYHGQKTSSGEPYDMYGMTAAHPTLPIPSYARVTNLGNGKSVVVRINDRGPFRNDRLIDLSYTAAYKLGLVQNGSAVVEVESIVPAGEATAGGPAAGLYAVAPEGADKTGIYLQLGAFGVPDNAELLRNRVRREFARVADAIHILAAGGLYRVRAGPFSTQSEAMQLAAEIRKSLDINAVLVAQ